MAVKLHRCSNIWVKLPGHPCWKVQKALDEKGVDYELVKHRYRGDREFKSTVDRYVVEFERLLNEVSADERGQATARGYLTSDTGKVYTMLAHAAGRFE